MWQNYQTKYERANLACKNVKKIQGPIAGSKCRIDIIKDTISFYKTLLSRCPTEKYPSSCQKKFENMIEKAKQGLQKEINKLKELQKTSKD